MKKYVQKGGIICGYLLLIAVFSDFRPEELFNLKEIFLVAAGCILLTLPYKKENKSKRELLEIGGNNAMISAYLVTFVQILGRASELPMDETLMKEILLSCRPLLYGFVILVLLKRPEEKKRITEKEKEANKENEEADKKPEKKSREEQCRELGLTARETEIVKLVLAGLTNREIGESLYIAESTVKKHLSNIFEKLPVENREQLKQLFK